MASSVDAASKVPAAFANARLSVDEAERLAAMFRPSWEANEAAGGATTVPLGGKTLMAGSPMVEPRAAAQASNGTHAPAVPAAVTEAEASIVVEAAVAPPSAKPGATILGVQAPQAFLYPAVTDTAPMPAAGARAAPAVAQRPQAPSFLEPAQTPVRARSLEIDRPAAMPVRSKTALWVGVAAAAAFVLGGGVWLLASSGSSEPVAPTATTTRPLDDKLSSVPPPPPELAVAAPSVVTTASATPTEPAPAATVAAPSAVTAAPPAAAAGPPPATAAAPTRTVAAATRPSWAGAAPAAAPRPAPRKGGQTIVRDVPF